MPNLIDLYKAIFLHVIPVRIIASCLFRYIDEIKNTGLFHNQLLNEWRDAFTTPATSKLKFFPTVINSLQLLVIIIQSSISLIVEVLDLPLA